MEPTNISEYEALAKQRMVPAFWDYYQGGSNDEVSLRANRTAFEDIRLRPRVLLIITHKPKVPMVSDQKYYTN